MFERFFGRSEPKKVKPRSSIERVVGGMTEQEKEDGMQIMTQRFENQSAKQLKGKEREKNEK